jgi:hypothetical protein
LERLLADGLAQASPVLDTWFEDRRVRLFRLQSSRVTQQLLGALSEVPLRTMTKVSPEEPTLLAVLPLTEPGVSVLPIHRAIRHVATFDPERFLTLAREYVRSYPLETPLDQASGLQNAKARLAELSAGGHAVLLVLPRGEGRVLRFRQALDLAHVRAAPRNPTLRSLDLSLLNALLLKTVLGIPEPERSGHPQVFTVPTLEDLVEGASAGTYQAGFGLNPPPTWELRAVMEAGESLPPHTFQLNPLPPDGLVFLAP